MKVTIVFSLWINLILFTTASADELSASLADIPNPGFSRFLDKMAEHYTDGPFHHETFPFPRSIQNAINGEFSFHMPLLENPLLPDAQLPYVYSTDSFARVSFVIYSQKDQPITRQQLTRFHYHITEAMINALPVSDTTKAALMPLIGTHTSWNPLRTAFISILGQQA